MKRSFPLMLLCFISLFADAQSYIPDSSFAINANNTILQMLPTSSRKIITFPNGDKGLITGSYFCKIDSIGQLVSNYGIGGIVTAQSPFLITSAAIDSFGGVITSGNYNNHFFFTRYNPDGTVDSSFATNGTYFSFTHNETSNAILIVVPGELLFSAVMKIPFWVLTIRDLYLRVSTAMELSTAHSAPMEDRWGRRNGAFLTGSSSAAVKFCVVVAVAVPVC